MSKFDEALNELRYQCHEVGFETNGGASFYKSSPGEIAAESALRAIHEEDKALAQQLAEALNQALELIRRSNREDRGLTVTDALDLPLVLPALSAAKAAGLEVP